MTKSIKVAQKKGRGHPATGRGAMVSLRFPPPTVSAVDDWARKNRTTRSDAIRRLVELGLTVKPLSSPSKKVVLNKDWAFEALASLTVERAKKK